ncbi:ABC transporter permease [Olleya sp. AH-315-K02]|nr:ABC transporter permease [Olleya sp. AH-315-K02]MBN4057969.1 ABC transporter permease [Olleya sp. AH-315-K02]
MILTIFKKDLKLFFSDKRAVMLTFLMPILLISLFAFAFGGVSGSSTTKKPIKLLVVDIDNSTDSKSVIVSLDSLSGLTLIPKEINEATSLVRKGKNIGVLIFEKGFQDSINAGNSLPMELKYDAAREIEIGMLQPVLMQNLMSTVGEKSAKAKMNSYFDKNFPGMPNEMKEKIFTDMNSNNNGNDTSNNNMNLKMTSIIIEYTKKGNLGLIQAVAGTAIMMLLFSIATIGGGLLDEKEAGTLKRLLYSPLKPTDILFGKMIAALVLAILQLVVMFVFSWLMFGLPIFMDITALLLMILTTAFAVSSFGIFLVAIAKTRQQLQSLSTIIILTMSAIGGSMIPLFVMPAVMQKIAVVSLNYWGIQGFYDIFWRNLPLIEILPKMGVLVGIGLVMTIISVSLFKKNVLKLVDA